MAISPVNNVAVQAAVIGGNAITSTSALKTWALTILQTGFDVVKDKTQRVYHHIQNHPWIYVGAIIALAALVIYRRCTKIVPQIAAPAPIAAAPPKADITARVRIHAGLEGGPIRSDKKYNFAGRLRYEDGKPYIANERDLYLSLEAQQPVDLKGLDTAADGIAGTYIRLPASLFAGRNNGDVVRFIWDDKTVELKCTAPTGQSFQKMLEAHRLFASRKACLWNEDAPHQVLYKGYYVGEEITILSPRVEDNADFAWFDEDEKLRPYPNCPSGFDFTPEGICFNPTFTGMPWEDIQLIKGTDFAGNTTLIVIVPHKKELMDKPFYRHGWYAIFPNLPPLEIDPYLYKDKDNSLHLVYKKV